MAGTPRDFAEHHRWDRNFFLLFLILCWLGVLMGFTPASVARLQGKADYIAPLRLHIHAASFTAWMVLLSAQILLIRFKAERIHRALGLTSLVLIPVMVISALSSEVYSQQFRVVKTPENLQFFIVPIFNATSFGLIAACAIAFRRHPSAHKRLIYLATSTIVSAAYSRWWGEPLDILFGDTFWGTVISNFTGLHVLLALAAAYDLVTRKRLHPVLAIGIPLLLAAELFVAHTYHNPAWPPIARMLIGR